MAKRKKISITANVRKPSLSYMNKNLPNKNLMLILINSLPGVLYICYDFF